MNYTIREIASIVKGEIKERQNSIVQEIVTDTRSFFHAEKAIFIALDGKKRNGHSFVEVAYKKGVRCFLVRSLPKIIFEDANYIVVSDTLLALQTLATYHRQKCDLKAIGITGSHGKTMVKEWLHQILWQDFALIKSPKSYNSQLGVPLSVLGIDKTHTHGVFEVGISEPNEMQRLEKIVQPNIGVITNITDAHLQNFESYATLVGEKTSLLKNCEKIVLNGDNEEIVSKAKEINPTAEIYSWGKNPSNNIRLIDSVQLQNKTELTFSYNSFSYKITIPFSDAASIENCCTLFAILISLELDLEKFLPKFKELTPIEMRLEINEGINNCFIINDGYNSDLHSIKVALEVLVQQKKPNKTLILSALHDEIGHEKQYSSIAKWVNESDINKLILIGDGIKPYKNLFSIEPILYTSTLDFLNNLRLDDFSNEAILIKGAYSYNFSQISDAFSLRSHDTILEINLHALINNLQQFKSKLLPSTKMMCMVKAFGYGTGGYEIAHALEFNGVDYLGVAYADEGAALRKSGVSLPIMVLNPEQNSYDIVIKNQLEPEIYSLRVLEKFIAALQKHYTAEPYPIHIKIDTGMNRLGFKESDVPKLIECLNKNQSVIGVKSIFTHLSSSEDQNEKEFTLNQIEEFDETYDKITKNLSEKPFRHILNSAGILNYPNFQYEMVRLGIGLYGFVSNSTIELEPVAKFKTVISQIKNIKEGESVSYNRKYKAEKNKKIAILPVGYADGIPRNTGNEKGFVTIHGQKATILGTICMDSLMVDVSNINCREGDEVCVFGNNPTIQDLAKTANTIPYEILTSISYRVKRVYYKE